MKSNPLGLAMVLVGGFALARRQRRALGAKADIRTTSYSLNPNYQYPKNGGKPPSTVTAP